MNLPTARWLSRAAIAAAVTAAAISIARYASPRWLAAATWLVLAAIVAIRFRVRPEQWALTREFHSAIRRLEPNVGYLNANTGQIFIHTTSRILLWTVEDLTVAQRGRHRRRRVGGQSAR